MSAVRVALPFCALAILLAAPALIPPYSLRVLDLSLVSSIAVIGLCFAFGYAGLVHLGQAAFVGVGAYASAILSTRYGLGFWITLPLALLMTAALGLAIGAPLLRLRGHYLALATVGFNVTVEIVGKNWISLTGGDDGISGIPGVSLAGFGFDSDRSFFYLACAFVALAAAIGYAIRRSRFGRAMIAVRDDELACGACGVAVFRTKLLAFTLAAIYGGLSGSLYAHYSNYIAPSDFDGVRAITLIVMLIVGGETSILGAIGGSILVSFAPEWLRFVGAAYLTVFGLAIVAVLSLLPEGLAGALLSLRARLVRRHA